MADNGKKQTAWGGRFHESPSPLMAEFSESVSFDRELARFDIQGSIAQAKMLASCGIITAAERDAIVDGLEAVRKLIESGKFEWKPEREDVHMNIEEFLTEKVPAAAKLHTARSRNDQVALDMRLYFRAACAEVVGDIENLMSVLVNFAESNKTVLIPGYTHLQRAQPVSAAHQFLAYVEMLARDRTRFLQVQSEANVCPLGSGAIAGSTLPIDREFVARELGFFDEDGTARITQNSMDAVADRDCFIDFAHACALCGVHLSRMAEDMILWNSAEFGYIYLPDAFTTGSSLMPQKKNPDCMELIRGKSARLQGNLHTLYTLVKGLPLTYNRDLQEDKPPVFDSMRQIRLCLQVMAGALGHKDTHLIGERCAKAVADPLLLATDLADYLVTCRVPFRKAHHAVGALVALAESENTPLNKLSGKDIKTVLARAEKKAEPFAKYSDDDAAQLRKALEGDWRKVFDLKRAISSREKPGMPGVKEVDKRIAYWKAKLGNNAVKDAKKTSARKPAKKK
jgi:argininosuccinate lyase